MYGLTHDVVLDCLVNLRSGKRPLDIIQTEPTRRTWATVRHGLSLAAFDKWLWHWSVPRGVLVNRTDLRGTWHVELRSTWRELGTGLEMPPIEGYPVVSRMYPTLGMRIFTAQSESLLRGAEIFANDDDTVGVVAVYHNEQNWSSGRAVRSTRER